jgi:hypothetical protein
MQHTDETTQPTAAAGLAARLERYAAIVSATLVAVVVVAAVASGSDASGQVGGDYPAFYGAGRIVVEGDGAILYDAARQATEQRGLLEDPNGYLYFAYPPFAAAGYAALAVVPYNWSVALHTLLMVAALGLAVRLASAWVPFIARRPRVSFAIALFFYPMLRAVIGGQNTALTLVLLCAAARLEQVGRPELAGVAVAGLLYKPQFGVPLALLVMAAGRWRVLRGWLAASVALYVVGAAVSGWGWPSEWWSNASSFADENVAANGGLFVSLPGLVSHLAPDSGAAALAGWVWTIGVGLAAAAFWRWRPHLVVWRHAVAAAALVAVTPQPLYYEVGLLLFPVALVATATGRGALLAGFWVLGAAELLDGITGFSPLAIVTMAVACGVAVTAAARTEAVS